VSPRLLALIPLAVGINLAMGLVVQAVGLPIFLDTIGTVMVAVLAGPVAAVVTGSLSQTVFTVWSGNPMWLTYLPLQIAIALYAALVARKQGFRTRFTAVAWGFSLGVLAATLSWPISYMVWGGVTSVGMAMVVTILEFFGAPLGVAVYVASIGIDVADKIVTFLIVRSLLVSLPNRVIGRFPRSAQAMGND
jgi:energy-coupling factor transport system substrate-specific component